MKKLLLMIMLLTTVALFSQQNPTLGIGLEALTFNKGTIDVEVLTKVIMKKQKELKDEALKRFMLKMFPDSNYTTRFYVQNCLNILLNEKNPQVIEKEILELTTNYAIALGVTKAVIEMDSTIFITKEPKLNKQIDHQKLLKKLKNDKQISIIKEKNTELKKLNNEIIKLSQVEKPNISDIDKKVSKIKTLEKEIKLIKRNFARYDVNIELIDSKVNFDSEDQLNFGEKLDLVSLALSENELLRKKGFFKNKINYREDQNYYYNQQIDDTIIKRVDDKIKHYVENYDIIKNFIENNRITDSNNIIQVLNEIYLKQIDLESNFFLASESNTILNENYKNEIKNLKNILRLKNDFEHLSSLKKTYANQVLKIDINSIKELSQNDDTKTITTLKNSYNNIRNLYNFTVDLNNTVSNIVSNPKLKDITTLSSSLNSIEITSLSLINENDFNVTINELQKLINEINQINSESILDDQKSQQRNDLTQNLTTKINLINDNIKSNQDKIKSYSEKIQNITELLSEIDKLDISNLVNLSTIQIDNVEKNISKLPEFFNFFINDLLYKIETQPINENVNPEKDNTVNEKIGALIAKIYERLNFFKNNKNYTLTDINYLENELLPQLVGIKYSDYYKNNDCYDILIKGIKNLTPLLKINILITKKLNDPTIKYDEKLISLFEFIGNLDKLDKAQTYSSIVDLIKKNSEEITNILPDGAFKDSYNLFINGIKKYTLINPNAEKEYVEIDVVSFLNDMQQYYNRNNPSIFSLYLTIGLNQNVFINKFTFPDNPSEQISAIGFASEKIGVKIKLHDFKKFKGYENAIKSDVYLNKRAPFFNEWFISIYGSGLLYSLANTSTNQNFNFSHVGFSTGLRFYNSLDFNVILGLPFVKNQPFGNNGFIGFGFDIPLGEYLEALGNK